MRASFTCTTHDAIPSAHYFLSLSTADASHLPTRRSLHQIARLHLCASGFRACYPFPHLSQDIIINSPTDSKIGYRLGLEIRLAISRRRYSCLDDHYLLNTGFVSAFFPLYRFLFKAYYFETNRYSEHRIVISNRKTF